MVARSVSTLFHRALRIEILMQNHRYLKSISDKRATFVNQNEPLFLPNFIDYSIQTRKPVFACYGYRQISMTESYVAVIYVRSKISIFPIKQNADALSFEFSGCYMATFKYGTQKYAAHIASDGNNDIKKYWNSIVQRGIITDCVLFEPTEPLNDFSTSCWGLITSSGDCYTINCAEKKTRVYDEVSRQYYNKYDITNNQPFTLKKLDPLKNKDAIIK